MLVKPIRLQVPGYFLLLLSQFLQFLSAFFYVSRLAIFYCHRTHDFPPDSSLSMCSYCQQSLLTGVAIARIQLVVCCISL